MFNRKKIKALQKLILELQEDLVQIKSDREYLLERYSDLENLYAYKHKEYGDELGKVLALKREIKMYRETFNMSPWWKM